MAKKKKKAFIIKIIISFIVISLIITAFTFYNYYQKVYNPNVNLNKKQSVYFFIPTGSDLNDVINLLYSENYIIDRASFEWVAEKKNYGSHINPGRYLIKNGISNNELINLLRSGKQDPVKVTFNTIRNIEQLAGKVTKNLECDSVEVITFLTDKEFISKYGFNSTTIITMFIPNTYEFYWNTSAEQFIIRMSDEYKNFWTNERKNKANKLGLSQSETSTLASIVQEETIKNDEKPTVAGVYINRLKKNMPLQADPTIKFALGDFTIRRVLKKHLKIDSPYNTYKYTGLPPGPICLPSISSIDAVLNYEDHNYIFFCAKEDFSGYHNFAKTLSQHNINARRYQQELNKRKIMK